MDLFEKAAEIERGFAQFNSGWAQAACGKVWNKRSALALVSCQNQPSGLPVRTGSHMKKKLLGEEAK